ncbi:MAG TPA: type VI secretion system baseplate subunit TssG [Chitinispirillaceae bacterium]|nr:type VI secretion system baseplate subunit TssG [Chitinispirillaceae bacterium]
MSDLIKALTERCYEFDFFQAVSLLEEYFCCDGCDKETIAKGNVRFSADTGITFPASDIHDAKSHRDAGVEMFLSFMGLLGISSPLPHYFTAYAAVHAKDATALIDFLNIFDHRMYSLFYRAWKKYRNIPTFAQADNSDLYNRVGYLSGFVKTSQKSKAEYLKTYAGLLSGITHNAAGLEEILTDCFKGVKVDVVQWAERWAKIEALKKIGFDFQLGHESMLGDRIYDRSGKINIVLELTDKTMFDKYLPGSENIEQVKEIVMIFAPQPLAFDIEVRFKPTDLIPVVLGSDTAPLGISSGCGDASGSSLGYSITIPGRE